MSDNTLFNRTMKKTNGKWWTSLFKTKTNKIEELPFDMIISQIFRRDKYGNIEYERDKKLSQNELFKKVFNNVYYMTGGKENTANKENSIRKSKSSGRQFKTESFKSNVYDKESKDSNYGYFKKFKNISDTDDSNYGDNLNNTYFNDMILKNASYPKPPKKISNNSSWGKNLPIIIENSVETDSIDESYENFTNSLNKTYCSSTPIFDTINKRKLIDDISNPVEKYNSYYPIDRLRDEDPLNLDTLRDLKINIDDSFDSNILKEYKEEKFYSPQKSYSTQNERNRYESYFPILTPNKNFNTKESDFCFSSRYDRVPNNIGLNTTNSTFNPLITTRHSPNGMRREDVSFYSPQRRNYNTNNFSSILESNFNEKEVPIRIFENPLSESFNEFNEWAKNHCPKRPRLI